MHAQETDSSVDILKISSQLVGASGFVDLHLLDDIENTVDNLRAIEHLLKEHLELAQHTLAAVSEYEHVIDKTGDRVTALEAGEKKLVRTIDEFRRMRLAVIDASELTGRHQNDVVVAYERVIRVGADLHNTSVEMRWAVMEHDANLDDPAGFSKLFDNAEDLIADLRG